LKRQRHTTQEGPPKVPGYIVTYSDMVTLLLTFFVLLLSLASVQDPELFNMGRGSFVQSMRELGLGMLYGRKPLPDFGNAKIKYFISTPDKPLQARTIHAKEEELRRLFGKVSRSMTTMPSQITTQKTNFSVTNIQFSPGEASLDKSAKRVLTEFCLSLQASRGAGILYVLGLARPGAGPGRSGAGETSVSGSAELTVEASVEPQLTEKQQQASRGAGAQWILSARRAQAVADFLQSALGGPTGPPEAEPSGPAWRIYWWGAGPGGDWVGQDSPISRQSQILIAVLRATD